MNKKYEVIADCNGANGLELKAGEIVRVISQESLDELVKDEKVKEISETE